MRYQTYDVKQLTDQQFRERLSRKDFDPHKHYYAIPDNGWPPDDQPNNHFFTAQYAPWAMAAHRWKAAYTSTCQDLGT